jgi:hypothetical protein
MFDFQNIQRFIPTKSKKDRLKILFCFLILIVLYGFHYYNRSSLDRSNKTVLICVKCRSKALREFSNINSQKCKLCGGKMLRVYKCSKCSYEFGVDEKKMLKRKDCATEEDFHNQRIVEKRCPNCLSIETYPMGKNDIGTKLPRKHLIPNHIKIYN